MNKIRKGDEVIVLTGRDKGKRGTVSLRKDDSYLVIDGINLVKKHVKPNPMKGTTGGIVESYANPSVNVAIFNAATGKADRVGIKVQADGSRVRVFKSSGAEIKGGLRVNMARLQDIYRDKVAPELTKQFGYTSPMQVHV